MIIYTTIRWLDKISRLHLHNCFVRKWHWKQYKRETHMKKKIAFKLTPFSALLEKQQKNLHWLTDSLTRRQTVPRTMTSWTKFAIFISHQLNACQQLANSLYIWATIVVMSLLALEFMFRRKYCSLLTNKCTKKHIPNSDFNSNPFYFHVDALNAYANLLLLIENIRISLTKSCMHFKIFVLVTDWLKRWNILPRLGWYARCDSDTYYQQIRIWCIYNWLWTQ